MARLPSSNQELASLYELAFEEAVRALDRQRATVDDLRSRAGLIFSASLVALTIVAPAEAVAGSSWLGRWIALSALGLAGLATLLVLWPRQWEWGFSPTGLLGEVERGGLEPSSLADTHRDLANEMELSYDRNELGVASLVTSLRIAYMLAGMQTLAMVAYLA